MSFGGALSDSGDDLRGLTQRSHTYLNKQEVLSNSKMPHCLLSISCNIYWIPDTFFTNVLSTKQTTCSSLLSSSRQPSSSPSRPFCQTPSLKSAMTSPFRTALKVMCSLLKSFWRTSLSPTTSKKPSHCIINFGLKGPSQLSNGMQRSILVLWNTQRSLLQRTAAFNILSREKTCPRLRKICPCPSSLQLHQYWCSPLFQSISNTPLATGTSYWWVSWAS